MNRFAKIIFYTILCTIAVLNTSCKRRPVYTSEKVLFSGEWQFLFNEKYYPASIPGNIHSDLFANKLIDDPFFGDNEKNLQWIGQQSWHYTTNFTVTRDQLAQHNELVFEGLDTRSNILVNGIKIAETDNMFRKWVFNVENMIHEGSNTLEVVFLPVNQYNDSMASALKYKLPDNRVFTRKAPYHSGWDWGPKYETCGIWKPVYLRSWKSFRIENFSILTLNANNNEAVIQANIIVESDTDQQAYLRLYSENNQQLLINKKVSLRKGRNELKTEFSIEKPDLWQCNGRGKANMAQFRTELQSGRLTDTACCISGIRTAKLISETDSIGQNFYFELNGKPVFAKGANWIPMESFPGSVSRDKYRKLLTMAHDARFNMLRIWGGGYYEDDAFYEICDSLGIMVWQDFIFACAVYPGDENFQKNVEAEANSQVQRLRHHPCLVLWCGNNEVSNGWNDWGWQQSLGYNSTDSASIWHSNRYLFEKLLPEIVEQNDGLRSYWPSSPMFGWGHPENNTHGDAHYWGVWWGKEDFEMYYEKTGRFMSEFGFQAMPSVECLKNFADSSDLNIDNPLVANHQKHPYGFENIERGMLKYLYKPTSFEEYVYMSQVLQATAMQTAFDAHFSAAPHCMGSLFWQYNDCWPSISWSAVDYCLNPKAVYYTAKRMFGEFSLCYRPKENFHVFYIFSDHQDILDARAEIEICDFSGTHIAQATVRVTIIGGEAAAIISTQNSIFSTLKTKDNYLRIKVYNNEQLLCSRAFFFERDNLLKLPESNIKISQNQSGDSIILQIESDKLSRWVALKADNLVFSDNYFDLMPGEKRLVTALPTTGELKQNHVIKVHSLNESMRFHRKHKNGN